MPERSRYTRGELAAMVGSAPKTVAEWSKAGSFPGPDVRDRFDATAFFMWWLQNKSPKSVRLDIIRKLTAGDAVTEEPAQSEDDDYQSRMHRAKALQQELKLAEQQGGLVRREAVLDDLGTVIRHLRTGADVLQRRFGNDAAEILEQAIKEAEKELGGMA